MMERSRYYTINQIAENAGVSHSTVKRVLKNNGIRTVRMGNFYLVRSSDYNKVLSYIKRQKSGSGLFYKVTKPVSRNVRKRR